MPRSAWNYDNTFSPDRNNDQAHPKQAEEAMIDTGLDFQPTSYIHHGMFSVIGIAPT